MSIKKNLPAEELKFSLGFFARLIWSRIENLHFAVAIRTFNEDGITGTVQHPAIKVDGLDEYVFDIKGAMFIPLDEDITVLPAQLFRNGNGEYTFQYEKEAFLTYSNADFLRTYKCKVLNSLLYKQKHVAL